MKVPKPHQLRGRDFIAERGRCALWWVPRRGKTLTTVLGLEKLGAKNVLIVCPKTVIPVWQAEFLEREWEGTMVCTGTQKKKLKAVVNTVGPVIVSYESAWRLPVFRRWDAIVFDESIRLSNKDAKSVICWLDNRHLTDNVILLSGAPCPEGYWQMASQMMICRGSWFNTRDIWEYYREYWSYNPDKYKWECDDHGHLAEVRRRMNIVGDVGTLKDIGVMDTKLYSTMPVEMSTAQIKYTTALAEDASLQLNVKALKLQMASNGLAGEGEDIYLYDNTKNLAVVAYLTDKLADEPGYQAIVLCRFVKQVEYLAAMLKAGMIHGGTSDKDRLTATGRFQQGLDKFIVCQVKTVKMGIDLSAASQIHYVSNSWSGDDRIQSQERATNLNKTEPVEIIDWCAHGVEYMIAAAVKEKKDFSGRLMMKFKFKN